MKQRDLRKIVTGFREGFLAERGSASMCFAMSTALEGYLGFLGVRCQVVKGEVDGCEHFWLQQLVDTGDILDATADQFKKPDGSDMPKVYIGVQPYWYRAESNRGG